MRNKFVSQMQSWIGRKEADGSHKAIIDIYNSHKPLPRGYKVTYTDKWCAPAVSACAIATGMTDIIPLECSCEEMINLAKAMGIWEENDAYIPNVADIILYDWQDSGKGDNVGWADHIGVVEKCDGHTITVIEGNINDSVGRRTLSVNGRYIRGYICPNYREEPVKAPENGSNEKKDEENEMRFTYLKDVPEYARPTVDKLMKKGLLVGKGGMSEETIIDLGEDALRVFVINDRAGLYGEG